MTTWVKLPTKQTSDRNQLESVKIVFSDFKGKFELENLPSLQSIQIGTIGSYSFNFYCSSFVIGGILNDIEYVMIRSS